MTTPTVTCTLDGHVANVRFEAPPHNFVSASLLGELADNLEALDTQVRCRAIVLTSSGKNFCAGADFRSAGDAAVDPRPIYAQAMRLFETHKPVVAAVQGAAIGAGLGLALAADFRVGCGQTRYAANFTRLGFHPGFGLSHTLPRLVGIQMASHMFYTGRPVVGEQALAIGLLDELVPQDHLVERAQVLALEISRSAPVAVQTTRQTLRANLAEQVRIANARESSLQLEQFAHADFREGVAAGAERRLPVFKDRHARPYQPESRWEEKVEETITDASAKRQRFSAGGC